MKKWNPKNYALMQRTVELDRLHDALTPRNMEDNHHNLSDPITLFTPIVNLTLINRKCHLGTKECTFDVVEDRRLKARSCR